MQCPATLLWEISDIKTQSSLCHLNFSNLWSDVNRFYIISPKTHWTYWASAVTRLNNLLNAGIAEQMIAFCYNNLKWNQEVSPQTTRENKKTIKLIIITHPLCKSKSFLTSFILSIDQDPWDNILFTHDSENLKKHMDYEIFCFCLQFKVQKVSIHISCISQYQIKKKKPSAIHGLDNQAVQIRGWAQNQRSHNTTKHLNLNLILLNLSHTTKNLFNAQNYKIQLKHYAVRTTFINKK